MCAAEGGASLPPSGASPHNHACTKPWFLGQCWSSPPRQLQAWSAGEQRRHHLGLVREAGTQAPPSSWSQNLHFMGRLTSIPERLEVPTGEDQKLRQVKPMCKGPSPENCSSPWETAKLDGGCRAGFGLSQPGCRVGCYCHLVGGRDLGDRRTVPTMEPEPGALVGRAEAWKLRPDDAGLADGIPGAGLFLLEPALLSL